MAKKILIVDDSKTSLFLERALLRGLPYDLIEASDGAQAIAKAVAEQPDLILMDMMMPRMDGLSALRELRRNPVTQSIPVVMVTTRTEVDRVAEAHQIGCDGYVTKPVDQRALLEKVHALLGEPR